MPYGDRTGPLGRGRMSGRGAGYCAGHDMPGYANPAPGRGGFGRATGRGFGQGFGRGRGQGRGQGFGRGRFLGQDAYPYQDTIPVYQEPSPEAEQIYLEDVVSSLEGELKAVKDRLKELAKTKK